MNQKKKNFYFQLLMTCFLCSLSYNVQAQEKYFFEKLSVSDGLSNSVVLCTYQDRLGYLWIGTMDGLNRYDGYDIKVYKMEGVYLYHWYRGKDPKNKSHLL